MIEEDSLFEIHDAKDPQEASQKPRIINRSVREFRTRILAIPAKIPQQFFQI
jgi:hypothetical protein